MKKIKFLADLKKKGVLEIVEPSEEIKKSYLKKSESNLESAKILLNSYKLEESIALSYYSMYNLVLALFFKCGIKCENHSAAIIILKEIFEIDNSEISEAKEERIDKQYYIEFYLNKGDVLKSISITERFNRYIRDFISKLDFEKIEQYKRKLKEAMS